MFRLPRPHVLLALVAAMGLVGGGLWLALSVLHDRHATLEDWQIDLGVSARLMEEHFRGIHTLAHSAMLRVEDRLRAGDPLEHTALQALLADIPNGAGICLHRGTGRNDNAALLDGKSSCPDGGRDRFALAAASGGRIVVTLLPGFTTGRGPLMAFSRMVSPGSGRPPWLPTFSSMPNIWRPCTAPSRPPIAATSS